MAFIDQMRAEGHAVESICRVLREQGCQIAARTYREWARSNRPVAARTITDAHVTNQVRDLAWVVDHEGSRRLTPEGLYGRRKMTALAQRTSPAASPGAVDRAMRSLGLQGVRRSKGIRTTIPSKDGRRAGDLLDRDFAAAASNRTWVMDFTYVRTWVGFVYVAFILDVFAQKIVACNVAPTKAVELVDVPLRMALWQRGREGHPVVRGELIGHADAGSQGGFKRSSQHLDRGGVDGQASRVDDGAHGAVGDEVAGCAVASSGGGAGVLARDRQWARGRGCREGCRRGASGWLPLVPARWRHDPVQGWSADRPILVVS